MKKIDVDFIINNKFFWLYFISTSFPNAMDEELDISLADFIYENYDCISAQKWVDSFVQFSEDILNENDGYVDDPNTIDLLLNKNNFRIEFHPYATVYIFNNEKIGVTGGNFKIRTLSWENFNLLINNCTNPKIPLLILPVLALDKSMIPKVKEIISTGLSLLNFKDEHINIISEMIIYGLL